MLMAVQLQDFPVFDVLLALPGQALADILNIKAQLFDIDCVDLNLTPDIPVFVVVVNSIDIIQAQELLSLVLSLHEDKDLAPQSFNGHKLVRVDVYLPLVALLINCNLVQLEFVHSVLEDSLYPVPVVVSMVIVLILVSVASSRLVLRCATAAEGG